MRTFILFFLVLPVFVLAQQQVVVKGTVLDEENKQPLPGASVLEKGTSNGVVTDFDGIFEINTTLGATLSISYVGLKTQEIVVESETVQVYLQTNLDQLDEVVVSVGYFDVSKKDLSGSISQVTTEKLEQNRTSSVEQLLQGQVSGVVISDTSTIVDVPQLSVVVGAVKLGTAGQEIVVSAPAAVIVGGVLS